MRIGWWIGGITIAGMTLASAPLLPVWTTGLAAQEVAYYRIGAGAPGSSSFDLAGLVAGAISAPPGSQECAEEGPCGVAGLQATANAAASAVDSLLAMGRGELESAVASADLVSQAAAGTGPFAKQDPLPALNAIANVGWSYLHVLVASDSEIKEGAELRGKRVALGAKNSDNALSAQFVLTAAGLSTKALTAMEGTIEAMAQAVEEKKASALVIVDGLASPDVGSLLKTGKYRLVPINLATEPSEAAAALVEPRPIPTAAYANDADIATLAMPFTWVVRSDADPAFVQSLAEALRRTAEHPMPSVTGAVRARVELDVHHLPVDFHPGAKKVLEGFVQPAPPQESIETQTN